MGQNHVNHIKYIVVRRREGWFMKGDQKLRFGVSDNLDPLFPELGGLLNCDRPDRGFWWDSAEIFFHKGNGCFRVYSADNGDNGVVRTVVFMEEGFCLGPGKVFNV